MVLIKPEQGVGHQKIADLIAAVIKNKSSPFPVLAFFPIVIGINLAPVKIGKAMCVFREMGRHPIEDHSETVAVAGVHEKHEIFGSAETACRRKIADDLVPPRLIQRMFADRHQFKMGIAPFNRKRNKPLGKLPVRQEVFSPFSGTHPGAQMHLINRNSSLERVA